MSVTLATIYANVRRDTGLTGSTTVSDTEDMPRWTRDAYAEIMRLNPYLRIKADGSMLARTLASGETSLPDELDEVQTAVEAYVAFRVHRMSNEDERGRSRAAEAYNRFLSILGLPTAPQE